MMKRLNDAANNAECNDAIYCMESFAGSDITLEQAQKSQKTWSEKSTSKRWAMLIDIRYINSISKEARDFYCDHNVSNGRHAIAIISDSFYSRVLANFFIGFYRGSGSIKLFSAKSKAIEWLKKELK